MNIKKQGYQIRRILDDGSDIGSDKYFSSQSMAIKHFEKEYTTLIGYYYLAYTKLLEMEVVGKRYTSQGLIIHSPIVKKIKELT